jgi:hypothetical protein
MVLTTTPARSTGSSDDLIRAEGMRMACGGRDYASDAGRPRNRATGAGKISGRAA